MTTRKTKTAAKSSQKKTAARKPSASKTAGSASTAGKQRRGRTPTERRGGAAAPTHERIAREAFLIWEASGRPQGQELSHWLEAERRLVGAPAEARAA